MLKVDLPVQTPMILPGPIVLISCQRDGCKPNLITIGVISAAGAVPAMMGFAVGHSRHSCKIISQGEDFVINVPSVDLVDIVDYCGGISGRKINKFEACGLTPVPSAKVISPCVGEFPLNIECIKRESVDVGSHDFIFGEIVAIHCDKSIIDGRKKIDKGKLRPMCLYLLRYWEVGKPIIHVGKSAMFEKHHS